MKVAPDGAAGATMSVVLPKVHAVVKAGDLVGVTVEHLSRNSVWEGGRVDAALAGLGPARVVDGGVDVGVEAVLVGADVVPGGVRLLVGEVDADDGFAALEAVLPGNDDANGGAILILEGVAEGAEGEERERVHGLVHAKAFRVGPIVAAGGVGHLVLIVEGCELDVLGGGQRVAEIDELGERVAVPGDDHGPGLDAAEVIDAGLDGAIGHEVVDADGLGLLDHAADLDGPGPGLEGFGVDLRGRPCRCRTRRSCCSW